jgi:hypothetical protein
MSLLMMPLGSHREARFAANASAASISLPLMMSFARWLPPIALTGRNQFLSKKLLKGDGCWTTRKVVLGWLLDTVRQTIELPSASP